MRWNTPFSACRPTARTTRSQPRLDAMPAEFLGHRRYRCGNDMVSTWAGSLAGEDGIGIVAGTGSIGYGEHAGRTARAGGWGELFSDEGSAYWIAIRGLNAFSRMSDGRIPRGPLHEILVRAFGLTEDLELCAYLASPARARLAIALLHFRRSCRRQSTQVMSRPARFSTKPGGSWRPSRPRYGPPWVIWRASAFLSPIPVECSKPATGSWFHFDDRCRIDHPTSICASRCCRRARERRSTPRVSAAGRSMRARLPNCEATSQSPATHEPAAGIQRLAVSRLVPRALAGGSSLCSVISDSMRSSSALEQTPRTSASSCPLGAT